MDSDSSNNRISLLQRDDWNFVYVEFSAKTTFTSASPLLFGASASGGKGGYVIEDLRLHNDVLTESEITNIHRTYDTNDVTVEFVSIPVERHMTDLSDVSSVNIIPGQILKFDGIHYVPVNDISDLSQSILDLSNQSSNTFNTIHIGSFTNSFSSMVNDIGYDASSADTILIGTSGELVLTDFRYNTGLGADVFGQYKDLSRGEYNTAIGYNSMYGFNNSYGSTQHMIYNTAVGAQSYQFNNKISNGGRYNVAIGGRAGYSVRSSIGSIYIGYEAGVYSSSTNVNGGGSYSIFMGHYSGRSSYNTATIMDII